MLGLFVSLPQLHHSYVPNSVCNSSLLQDISCQPRMPCGITLSSPLSLPAFLQIIGNAVSCITTILGKTLCAVAVLADKGGMLGWHEGNAWGRIGESVQHKPCHCYWGSTGPMCVAAPQRNIPDTTAAEMEGQFSFPVKAGVTGLHLGSEPPKLGEWSAARFPLGWAELCLCFR